MLPFFHPVKHKQSVRNFKGIHKLPSVIASPSTWYPYSEPLKEDTYSDFGSGSPPTPQRGHLPQRNSSFGAILRSVKLHLVVIYANLACFNFSPSASSRFRLFKTLGNIS